MYEKLAYKGFTSTPRYDIEGKVIYGTIDEIDGFASYEAKMLAVGRALMSKPKLLMLA